MDEAEETENDFSFNFLDFVDQELEDNVNDEDSNSFVDLEFVSDEENGLKTTTNNLALIILQTQAMQLLEPLVTFVAKKLASRT